MNFQKSGHIINFTQIERGSRGFTLPEILVSIVITAITSLAAGSIVLWIIHFSNTLVEKNHAETNLLTAGYRFKTALSLGINIGNSGVAVGDLCTSANPANAVGGCVTTAYNIPGSLTNFSSTNLNGHVDTLARFYREGGITSGNVVESAIFFRRPDTTATYDDGAHPSGALYFVSNSPGQPLAVGPENDVYDHISNLSVQVNTVPDTVSGVIYQRAKNATIVITARYFLSGQSTDWIYCPLGLCTISQPFKDVSLNVSVNFVNNVLHVGDPLNGDPHILNTLFGNIYFFQTQIPTY